ncbi:MAG: type II toxin-antitoxin system HicB family antitoxin [Peptostreptococcaceae bacterium]
MKNSYIFPAIFYREEDGYNVYFPDIAGAFTCGDTFEEAMFMAKDCLELCLSDVDNIPTVGEIDNIKLKKGEYIVMIKADMIEFRKKYQSQLIKKTLTIPQWLNDLGIEKGVNFSSMLVKALKKELGVE